MSALGEPQTDDGPVGRSVLERTAIYHRRAALILRASGRASEAARAEQFATRARLTLDEPSAIRRMHAVSQTVSESSHPGLLLERALAGALSLIGGGFGNIQLHDPITGGLRIAAQCGFSSEFLEYFAVVDDDASACGRAASLGSQTVIVDVNDDVGFAPHRQIAAAAGFRAVQSTPLVDRAGRLRGVISTHYQSSHRPCRRDLEIMQWYGELVGAALADQQSTWTPYEVNGALHARTADPHVAPTTRMNGTGPVLLADVNGAKTGETHERARRVRDRARQARERAQALAERVTAERKRYPPLRSTP